VGPSVDRDRILTRRGRLSLQRVKRMKAHPRTRVIPPRKARGRYSKKAPAIRQTKVAAVPMRASVNPRRR
jgi:hypothetical protein